MQLLGQQMQAGMQAVGADGMAVEAENIRAQLRATAVTARPATTSLIHALENGSLEERTEAAAALEELVTCSRETGQVREGGLWGFPVCCNIDDAELSYHYNLTLCGQS
jgi:hypothetical protein